MFTCVIVCMWALCGGSRLCPYLSHRATTKLVPVTSLFHTSLDTATAAATHTQINIIHTHTHSHKHPPYAGNYEQWAVIATTRYTCTVCRFIKMETTIKALALDWELWLCLCLCLLANFTLLYGMCLHRSLFLKIKNEKCSIAFLWHN